RPPGRRRPTTSPHTVAPAIWGNCIAADPRGPAGLGAPACCGNAGTMQIEHVHIVPHHGRSGLVLRSGLRGMDLAGVRSGKRDVVLQLRGSDGPTFCARVPAASLVAGRRGPRLKGPRPNTAG